MSSTNKTYSHYPKSERKKHVEKIITEELNVLEYAEKVKIAPSSLYRWIKQYENETEKPLPEPEPEPEQSKEQDEEKEVEKIEEEIIKNLKTVEKPESKPEPESEPEQGKQKTKKRRMDIIMLSMVGISIGLISILLIQNNNKKGREKNDDRDKNGKILERESRIAGIRDL